MTVRFFSKIGLTENKYLILGHLTFFVLFIFSFIFANERVIYIDSAAQIFEFIRDEGFEIYAQRYSMYLFQTLPVLAVKLHLPLQVVIYAYSLSIPLIAYLLWIITVYFLKNREIGILMLFVMLGIRQTFFHAISETFQLMFFAAFLYAWLFQNRNFQISIFSKVVYYLVACVFIALCIFIHPVAIFFVIFILGFYLLNEDISISQKIIISILFVGMICLKFLTTAQGSHDTTFIISVQELFNRVSEIFTLYSTTWYFGKMEDFYWVPLLMFIISLVTYLRKKKYWHFAFVFGFVILFWVITVVVYALGDGEIGMERSFLPLFFFCGLPFAVDAFPTLSIKWNKVFFVGLAILLLVAFTKIALASTQYTQRLKKIGEISALANRVGMKKILIEQETAKQIFSHNFFESFLGLESMIYSTLKGIDSTVNLYVVANNTELDNENYKKTEYYFAVHWWTFWEVDKLNPHYFKLPKQLPAVLDLENEKMVIKEGLGCGL